MLMSASSKSRLLQCNKAKNYSALTVRVSSPESNCNAPLKQREIKETERERIVQYEEFIEIKSNMVIYKNTGRFDFFV